MSERTSDTGLELPDPKGTGTHATVEPGWLAWVFHAYSSRYAWYGGSILIDTENDK